MSIFLYCINAIIVQIVCKTKVVMIFILVKCKQHYALYLKNMHFCDRYQSLAEGVKERFLYNRYARKV